MKTTTDTDKEILRAATILLHWNPSVPQGRIQVDVSNGQLILRGSVTREYEKLAAERTVQRVSGLAGVSNLIEAADRARFTA